MSLFWKVLCRWGWHPHNIVVAPVFHSHQYRCRHCNHEWVELD